MKLGGGEAKINSFFQQDPYKIRGYAWIFWFLLPFARDNEGNWWIGGLAYWWIAAPRSLYEVRYFWGVPIAIRMRRPEVCTKYCTSGVDWWIAAPGS